MGLFYPNNLLHIALTGCSATLALVVIEDGAEDLSSYSGEYTSNLDIDTGGYSWWMSEDNEYCIWRSDDLWRVGFFSNMGTTEADIVSKQPSDCPHGLITSTGERIAEVTWKYNTEGVFQEAEPHGIFTITGKCINLVTFHNKAIGVDPSKSKALSETP